MTARSNIVLTGAGGSLGRRVVALLEADESVATTLVADPGRPVDGPTDGAPIQLGAGEDPLIEAFDGAAVLVHLAFQPGEGDGELAAEDDTRRVLDAAGRAGVEHAVLMSSATVYGAWPDNPVPLTEEAPVRPNPGAGYPNRKAEIERLGAKWASEGDGRTVTVLRPAVAVAGGESSWLARSLGLAAGIRAGDTDPPFQLLHLDDLASAVDLARRQRLDGTYNVAPDGWLSGEQTRALAGDPPRVRVPERAVTAGASLLWRWRVGRMPPGLVPYTVHPWVVANDRLRAEGWAPAVSNEEAYVEATPGTPWSRLSPKRRREELALGAAGSAMVGGLAGITAIVARARRRR